MKLKLASIAVGAFVIGYMSLLVIGERKQVVYARIALYPSAAEGEPYVPKYVQVDAPKQLKKLTSFLVGFPKGRYRQGARLWLPRVRMYLEYSDQSKLWVDSNFRYWRWQNAETSDGGFPVLPGFEEYVRSFY